MGSIRRRGTEPGTIEYLYQHHTVGRAASCQLILDRAAVSGHHATIRWSEGEWTLRDLGSRNGTFLNGRRIASTPEHVQPLAKGDLINFAESDELWELIDTSAPKPLLVPLDPDPEAVALVLDAHDVLALPSAKRPLVTIFQRYGAWQLERDGECSLIEDRQELLLDGRRYRLLVAGELPETSDAESQPIECRVHSMQLEIVVSRDEESAGLLARLGADVHELRPRTYLYLLAFLGRRRLADAEAGRGRDAGWVDVETVCDELRLASAEALGLLVYRCRRAIQGFGVTDPAEIVDRSQRGRVRIGVDAEQLQVRRLD